MANIKAFVFKDSKDADYQYQETEYKPQDVAEEAGKIFDLSAMSSREKEDFLADYARLLGIREKAAMVFSPEKLKLGKAHYADGDKLVLLIEGMKPSGLSLAIVNGQLEVKPDAAMTPEKYQDLARLCEMNSIEVTEDSFPKNADEKFKDDFLKAMDVYENTGFLGYAASAEEKEAEAVFNEQVQNENIQEKDDDVLLAAANNQENTSGKENKPVDFKKIKDNMASFMEVRNGKVKDSTYFRTHTWNGWLDYRIYAKPEDRKADGTWDAKTKTFKDTYEIDIRFKEKDGVLHCNFSTPGRKCVDGMYADEIVSTFKSHGYTTIDFGNITDQDKGKFRDSCACFGVLPSFNLGEKHARSMLAKAADNKIVGLPKYKLRMAKKLRKQIEKGGKGMESEDNKGLRAVIIECEAENGIVAQGIKLKEADVSKMLRIAKDNLTETELLDFKHDLAVTLNNQMVAENSYNDDNPLKKLAEGFADEYNYTPFKKTFEQVLKHVDLVAKGDDETRRAKAEDVIGAMDTAKELFGYYKEFGDKSLADFMASGLLNLDEEKTAFLQACNIPQSEFDKVKFKDMGRENMMALYKVMIPENTEKAQKRLEAATSGLFGEGFKDEVAREVKASRDRICDVAGELEEMGLGRIRVSSVGNPVFVNKNNVSRQQNRNNFNRGNSR